MSTSDKKEDQILTENYYKRTHLWKGNKAIKELVKAIKIPKKNVIQWLASQALWQVHLPSPRKIIRPHFNITQPNKMHQFDLLYMPGDILYGTKYKYILTGIDVASRFKVVRPLKTKTAKEVCQALEDIYKIRPLKYPEIFQCDNGSEFKGEVTKLFEKHGVKINRSTTKYHHRFTAFVERFNKTLAERLFKTMDAQELEDPEKISTIWVQQLYDTVDILNNEKTAMIGMKPKNAIKLKHVNLVKQEKEYPPEDVLPTDGLYRYLYQKGEQHGDQRRRATDFIWSKNTYHLDEIIQDDGNKVLYYLRDGPKRSFVREELMLIPEETQLPPDYVQNWS